MVPWECFVAGGGCEPRLGHSDKARSADLQGQGQGVMNARCAQEVRSLQMFRKRARSKCSGSALAQNETSVFHFIPTATSPYDEPQKSEAPCPGSHS